MVTLGCDAVDMLPLPIAGGLPNRMQQDAILIMPEAKEQGEMQDGLAPNQYGSKVDP